MSESEAIVLSSPANATIRHLVRMRDNRARRKASRVLVDGPRETSRAIDAGLELCGFYVNESWPGENTDWLARHERVRSAMTLVTEPMMQRISYGQSSRGIVAEFQRPDWGLDRLRLPPTSFVLVLDKIEKPGNIGAVFRCADAAGVDAVLLSDCQDLFNPNAIRNSQGAVFHVACATGSQAEIAAFLSENDFRVLAARVESSDSLWSVSWDGPVAFVLGSESDGLGSRWQTIGQTPVMGVKIPMSGQVDSLNVSVTAAIIAFEAARLRNEASD